MLFYLIILLIILTILYSIYNKYNYDSNITLCIRCNEKIHYNSFDLFCKKMSKYDYKIISIPGGSKGVFRLEILKKLIDISKQVIIVDHVECKHYSKYYDWIGDWNTRKDIFMKIKNKYKNKKIRCFMVDRYGGYVDENGEYV